MPLVSHALLVGMSRTFKTVDYAQALNLTVRLGDCLPPEHLARFVVDSVALLGVSSLYAHYGSRGGEPYARGACYWACFSMAMRRVCSVRARSSGPPMRRCPSASSPATACHDSLAELLDGWSPEQEAELAALLHRLTTNLLSEERNTEFISTPA